MDALEQAFSPPPDKEKKGSWASKIASPGASPAARRGPKPQVTIPADKLPVPKKKKASKMGTEFITDGEMDPTIDIQHRRVMARDQAQRENTRRVVDASPATIQDEKLRAELAKTYKGTTVIDPRRSRFMPMWDVVMISSLLYTAVVTPYEVTFVEEGACVTILFVINRMVDCLFLTDIMIIFNLAFQERDTGVWVYDRGRVRNHAPRSPLPRARAKHATHATLCADCCLTAARARQIAKKYLCGFFFIDLFSLLPFYLTAFYLTPGPVECSAWGQVNLDALMDNADANLIQATQSLKIMKLMRMFKLARVLKASRVLKRLLQDLLMTKFECTFAVLTVWKLFIGVSFLAHWQACIWALISVMYVPVYTLDDGTQLALTWVDKFRRDQADLGVQVQGSDIYVASLYWSIMTLTSIGYGDFVPVNTVERALCCFYMVLSAGERRHMCPAAHAHSRMRPPHAARLAPHPSIAQLPLLRRLGIRHRYRRRHRRHPRPQLCALPHDDGPPQLLYARPRVAKGDAPHAAGLLSIRPRRPPGGG